MMTERYKVWYLACGKKLAVHVDAMSFVEVSLTAQRCLNAEILKIVHCDSGLEDHQLEIYKKIQARCYEARWFGYGDTEKEKQATEDRVDFEYSHMPKLEFVNLIQTQLYIPPYKFERLPSHLQEVVTMHSKKEKATRA